jgi:hypothetical protein
MSNFPFNYDVIPDHMMEGLRNYIDHGYAPGHFMGAVLRNDLKTACARADLTNMRIIPVYVAWLWNNAPATCWGDGERVSEWMAQKALDRAAAHENI